MSDILKVLIFLNHEKLLKNVDHVIINADLVFKNVDFGMGIGDTVSAVSHKKDMEMI